MVILFGFTLLVLFAALGFFVLELHSASHARVLRFDESFRPVPTPRLLKGEEYHLFLSHAWVSGQDQMRIIKQRLSEALPGVTIFLVRARDALSALRLPSLPSRPDL